MVVVSKATQGRPDGTTRLAWPLSG